MILQQITVEQINQNLLRFKASLFNSEDYRLNSLISESSNPIATAISNNSDVRKTYTKHFLGSKDSALEECYKINPNIYFTDTRQHTEAVRENFLKYFVQNFEPGFGGVTAELMVKFLELHDLYKPIFCGEKENCIANVKKLKELREKKTGAIHDKLTVDEFEFIIAIVSKDPLGTFLQGESNECSIPLKPDKIKYECSVVS